MNAHAQVETRRSDKFFAGALFQAEQPLTMAELEARAPSIFAVHKHSSRSDRYTYLSTRDAVQALMDEGFQPVAVRQGGSRDAGKVPFTKHVIRFRHPTAAMQARQGVVPEIALKNSHDGTSSWVVMGGAFRPVCRNGLYYAEGLSEFKVGHTKKALSQVVDGTWTVVRDIQRPLEQALEWQGVQLGQDAMLALAISAHRLRFPDQEAPIARAIDPVRLLRANREEDRGANLWLTFNRLQENITKGGIEGTYTRTVTNEDGSTFQQTRSTSMREVKNVDDDVRLNRELWDRATKLADMLG